jgi:hypothetical protein
LLSFSEKICRHFKEKEQQDTPIGYIKPTDPYPTNWTALAKICGVVVVIMAVDSLCQYCVGHYRLSEVL